MNEPEQQFYAWVGRGLLGAVVGAVAWLWVWMWNQVHKSIPRKHEQLEQRLEQVTREFATKAEVTRMEQMLRDALREQGEQFREALREHAEQRREMHDVNARKLDAISADIRALGDEVRTGLREAHKRVDDHIGNAHSKS